MKLNNMNVILSMWLNFLCRCSQLIEVGSAKSRQKQVFFISELDFYQFVDQVNTARKFLRENDSEK